MGRRRSVAPEDDGPPGGARRVLLLACCAPCAGGILEILLAEGLAPTVFFYAPNIHPRAECERRLADLERFCAAREVPLDLGPYEVEAWHARTRGLAGEPERGRRCAACFDLRLERAAARAHETGHVVFTSTLGVSRWKDWEQATAAGLRAAAAGPGPAYWTRNWRKRGGSRLLDAVAAREGFYRQRYCGCVYSQPAAARAGGGEG